MGAQAQMLYPMEAEVLGTEPLPPWIDREFLRPDPFAFSQSDFYPIVECTVEHLGIDANSVYCIGSGAIGLSINPSKMISGSLKLFDENSDIDLAIISEYYFQQAWRDVRLAASSTSQPVSSNLAEILSWQRKRFFDGVILGDRMLPHLSFGSTWISGFAVVKALIVETLGREIDVHFWLYRDYWSVREYVSTGVNECRNRARL